MMQVSYIKYNRNWNPWQDLKDIRRMSVGLSGKAVFKINYTECNLHIIKWIKWLSEFRSSDFIKSINDLADAG